MKMNKKLTLLGLALAAVTFSATATALVTPTANAETPEYSTATVTDVATVEGASVRIMSAEDEYKGIRFGAYVNTA